MLAFDGNFGEVLITMLLWLLVAVLLFVATVSAVAVLIVGGLTLIKHIRADAGDQDL